MKYYYKLINKTGRLSPYDYTSKEMAEHAIEIGRQYNRLSKYDYIGVIVLIDTHKV